MNGGLRSLWQLSAFPMTLRSNKPSKSSVFSCKNHQNVSFFGENQCFLPQKGEENAFLLTICPQKGLSLVFRDGSLSLLPQLFGQGSRGVQSFLFPSFETRDDVAAPRVKLSLGVFIGSLELLQGMTNFDEVVGEGGEFAVEFVRLLIDFVDRTLSHFALPEMVGELKCHEEIRGVHGDDVAGVGIGDEGGVGLHGGDVGTFDGHKHEDIADAAADDAGIVFLGQFPNVLAQALDVFFQKSPALFVVLGGDTVGVGFQRDFGVNHETAVVGKIDDHVGNQRAAFSVTDVELEGVVSALGQSARLEEVGKDGFAPVSLEFGTSFQRLGEILCFASEVVGSGGKFLHVVVERGVGDDKLRAKGVDVLCQRFEKCLESCEVRFAERIALIAPSVGGEIFEFRLEGFGLRFECLCLCFETFGLCFFKSLEPNFCLQGGFACLTEGCFSGAAGKNHSQKIACDGGNEGDEKNEKNLHEEKRMRKQKVGDWELTGKISQEKSPQPEQTDCGVCLVLTSLCGSVRFTYADREP